MKIEILSNINMDGLKFYLKDYSFNNSCSYGNYLMDLIDENSSIYKNDSEAIILFLDFDEFHENIDDIISGVDNFIKKTNKLVIMNTFKSINKPIDTFLYKTYEKELQINLQILNFAKKNSNILILNLEKILSNYTFYDEKYWYLGRMKFSKKALELIAKDIDILIKTYKFGSKKLLILDLDNTLWGGIIAEDEIKLSNDGEGKIFVDFQKNIKKLKDLGILLAICSKNNYEDGIKGLNHINSILKEDDFIVKKINWQDKATNIEAILKELNLGESSAVFIDDNPVEREYVKSILPEVIVPDFPDDIYYLSSWFLDIVEKYFAKINLTKEDLKKQEQYIAKIKRDSVAKKMSYDDFLKQLNIKIDFLLNDEKHIERYAQMTQKTNQFNLTTKRYSVADIKNFIKSKDYDILAINYQDKFANEGITGLLILKKNDKNIEIDTFLLSCRILKRDVEKAILKKLEKLYKGKTLIGYYYPTKKNMQTKDLYPSFGFKKIDENRYVKEL